MDVDTEPSNWQHEHSKEHYGNVGRTFYYKILNVYVINGTISTSIS